MDATKNETVEIELSNVSLNMKGCGSNKRKNEIIVEETLNKIDNGFHEES